MTANSSAHKNIFTSKANVLKFLKPRLKKAHIEDVVDFTVRDWNQNEKAILTNLQKFFRNNYVIVRSSAKGEDSLEKSAAGNYESVLNINPNSEDELKKAVSTVISSYRQKGSEDEQNQILVQKQIRNPRVSGVIFTRTPNVGAPYYVINFDESSSTDKVTKGENSNVIKIFRGIDKKNIPSKWKHVIESVREIESVLRHDHLDIEFCTVGRKVIIFQVRPITVIDNAQTRDIQDKIAKIISENKRKFKKLAEARHIPGKRTVFSDMSDWNPSEIIGNNPNLLDYSLYEFLIMKRAWSEGRQAIGYQDVDQPLMVRFGNKPYVDLRASFNSLMPATFSNTLKRKLINYYFKKIARFPHLHDKIEFEIVFSCYDMMIDNRLSELSEYGFDKKEIKEISRLLTEFTNTIIKDFTRILADSNKKLEKMQNNRAAILRKLYSNKPDHCRLLNSTKELLLDCRELGTVPFSTMARIAFIGTVLLKSMRGRGSFDDKIIETFMSSISTPLSEFQEDVFRLQTKKITQDEFMGKYGHLRPGTYDITALRYDNQPALLSNLKELKTGKEPTKTRFYFPDKPNTAPLVFDENGFFDFIRESLVQRERLKFEFTKNLSESLELIAKSGELLGLTREEMSNLSISAILDFTGKKKKDVEKQWKSEINKEAKRKKIRDYLVLPPLIFSEKDFDVFRYHISKPNFITTKKITGELVHLERNSKDIPDFDSKIVLIENADPGFDWIFAKNPKGLITKYGGVASHMSIRCAEISLPAAIGCEEILFEKLLNSKQVLLDCENNQIISIESKESDEFMEVKKTLKSLGYIK